MLLDGGFVKHKLGASTNGQANAEGISAFIAQVSALPILNGMRLHRIYFYDSRPLETSETNPWGADKSILEQPKPHRETREADSDFIPAMKFARREGAQLILVTLGHGVRPGLKEHADIVIDKFPLPPPVSNPAA